MARGIRVFIGQVNTLVGHVEGNQAKAESALERAAAAGADLLLLPEQTLPGYPAKDLLTFGSFVKRNRAALENFARATAGRPAALIGFPEAHDGPGNGLYNAAALCRDGRVEKVFRKILLPTYDVFDEDRHFDEGSEVGTFDLGEARVGVTICEDLWNDELYWSRRRYGRDPGQEVVDAGAEIVVNLSASPYTMGKRRVRRDMIAAAARRHGVPVVQANLVGANDDLIFDGSSFAVGADGTLGAMSPAFEEHDLVVDIDPSGKATGPMVEEIGELEELRRALTLGVRDYVTKCGFREVLIGLSGGIDSALVAVIAAEALGPHRVHAISMPSRYSTDHSKSDAQLLAENLGISYREIPIEGMFAQAIDDVGPHLGRTPELALENMQPRLRGMTLMSLSNATGAMVLTTGNKSEMSVGYTTLYGDMCGGLAVISDVPKTLVYALCRHINASSGREVIPESILTKAPSAELAPDQKDSDSLPEYDVLDPIIRGFVEDGLSEDELVAEGHDREIVRKVLRLVIRSEYKRRQAAPTLKVTSRAFGYGWRMPIARG